MGILGSSYSVGYTEQVMVHTPAMESTTPGPIPGNYDNGYHSPKQQQQQQQQHQLIAENPKALGPYPSTARNDFMLTSCQ